jgi:chromosome segregation protein
VYLKQIEINGFKSFADKTRLQFEPGMIAIVGPNGCGKSNVSDAIRWVLGEQRPTALRCSKMSDVIFSGTDSRKPLGMAEVSITFAECEGVLDCEFDEVTVTRRVFRSGEGQYLINKNLCRLKDVQRLFMGTGIGTTSYSVMAQGQIDVILSSRPEDRRTVFEEAAGITKFKADRKEAMRKIEQTEANLLRLADVIREVKRQIGSLQRQAGKARKYKVLRDELRGLDIFLTRQRLAALDVRIRELDVTLHELTDRMLAQQRSVAESEADSAHIHELIHETEQRVAALAEQAAQADNRYLRAQEVIKVNEQRIIEYKSWAERDNREISETRQQIEQIRLQLEALDQKRLLMKEAVETEREKMAEAQARFDEHKGKIDQARNALQEGRRQSVECERRVAQIQQTVAAIEERQREALLKRERLASERSQIDEHLGSLETTCGEVKTRLDSHADEAEQLRDRLDTLEEEREAVTVESRALQDETSRMRSEAAAKRAQIDLLCDRDESDDDFADGAKKLLDPADPLGIGVQAVLGPLADKFNAPSNLRLALEAALRSWLDAVVVRDSATMRQALALLLAQGQQAAARLVPADLAAEEPPAPPAGLTRLLDHVKVTDDFESAAQRLLGSVFFAETLEDVTAELPAGCSVVTRSGAMIHANGCAEVWMPDSQVSSPLSRHMLVADTNAQLADLDAKISASSQRLEQLSARANELALSINQTRQELDASRRQAAQAEGEYQSLKRDVERVAARQVKIAEDLNALSAQTGGDDESRTAMIAELADLNNRRNQLLEQITEDSTLLQELESVFNALSHELTERRIQFSSATQQVEHIDTQREAVLVRIAELERTLQGRSRGVMSYDESIARLKTENETLQGKLEPMRAEAAGLHERIAATRCERDVLQRDLAKSDTKLAEHRQVLDVARDNKGKAEIELAESRIHRQSRLDHVYNEYGLSPEELVACADPAWKDGAPPPLTEIEQKVASLNIEIQELGPVNLVAIEEYRELEERYVFLKAQEDDLLSSKEQILDLITTINTKSAELFQTTFEQASANFEKMFTKLFNGGQAKLVLLDNNEDPLECGIDIIARPPGKRPQSVTLLSGGERTMTAVSLLFAIFMIKPAPFCMLDELDASLDDSNIGRFIQTLQEFLQHSQFLIITHNQHTIAGSDIVYGVTQQEKGVSKIVSMRLKEIGTKELSMGEPEPSAPTVAEDAPKKQSSGG